MASLAGCQPAPAPVSRPIAIGADRIGYVVLTAQINPSTLANFTTVIGRMVELGALEIHIAINSPGGVIRSAEAMIAFMDRTHAERGTTFVTHDIGVVASAACYVFLAGQHRYSVPGGAFLFHEAGVQANGILTGETLERASAELKQEERGFLDMLRTHTRLTDGEAQSFVRRTVLLSAPEAMRDGVIEGIAPFLVPKGTPFTAIRTKPPNAPATPSAPGPTN